MKKVLLFLFCSMLFIFNIKAETMGPVEEGENLIVNQENQIVLNNGRFKLCINNEKELKIIEPKDDYSEISKEVYYMVR